MELRRPGLEWTREACTPSRQPACKDFRDDTSFEQSAREREPPYGTWTGARVKGWSGSGPARGIHVQTIMATKSNTIIVSFAPPAHVLMLLTPATTSFAQTATRPPFNRRRALSSDRPAVNWRPQQPQRPRPTGRRLPQLPCGRLRRGKRRRRPSTLGGSTSNGRSACVLRSSRSCAARRMRCHSSIVQL